MLFTAAICDDNEEDIQLVLSYLEKYEAEHSSLSFATKIFTDPNALLSSQPCRFDIYFLDILMKDISGIDLARRLRGRHLPPSENGCIIFLTSSPDYALPAFSVYASGYLVKPVTFDAFSSTLDMAVKYLTPRKTASQQHFSFRAANGFYNTLVEDIRYVEIMGHTPYYHLTTGTVRGSDLRISFGKSIQPLLDTGLFLLPHRSFAVNISHVVSFSMQELVLDNKDKIPISRNRFNQTKAQYMDFLMEDSIHV